MPVDRYRANVQRDRVARERGEEHSMSCLATQFSAQVENTYQRSIVGDLVKRLEAAAAKEPERWSGPVARWKRALAFLTSTERGTLSRSVIKQASRMHHVLAQYERGTLPAFTPTPPDSKKPRRAIPVVRTRPPLAPFLSDATLLPKKPPGRST